MVTFNRYLLFLLLLICYRNAVAETDKYRLILKSDPSSTITIAWNQVSGTDAKVHYGTQDFGTDATAYPYTQVVSHSTDYRGMSNQFTYLSGLEPNTAYYFVISDSEGTSQRFWFKTAPADNSRLFFISGGDSRNNRTPRQNANTLVGKLKPHAVFFAGDMTDDDTSSEWQAWLDDWQLTTSADGRMIPIVPARGNHEGVSVVYELFDTPNEDAYYALTWGADLIRTYTLNSEISVLGDQLTWLEEDLANVDEALHWKMAQYHKPMRPHTSGKSEGNAEYDAWAQLFYDEGVRLVIDSDSHMSKTTWPVRPSYEEGSEEGFIVDHEKGTVYTGEGCWGAPLRNNDDDKSWTRNSGSFNQFKAIFIDEEKIEIRTIQVSNASEVTESSNEDPFTLPENLLIFSPPTGDVVTLSDQMDTTCPIAGTTCDDEDDNTLYDESDGMCGCEGLSDLELVVREVPIAAGTDDASEDTESGLVSLSEESLPLASETPHLVAIRFAEVEIPEGATLYRAYIQFSAEAIAENDGTTDLTIYGEKSANSAPLEAVDYNLSSRSTTDKSVYWNNVAAWTNAGASGINQRTPYLTGIVAEITTQDGWQSGNSMTFILSGQGHQLAQSFESGTPPVLKLLYQDACEPKSTECDDGNETTIVDVQNGECLCVGLLAENTSAYQISAEEDDAEEYVSNGEMNLSSSDLEMVFEVEEQIIGLRFTDILVPNGAIILHAAIQFTSDEADDEETHLQIWGEKVTNSLAFEASNYNISSRTRTEASANWPNVPVWAASGRRTDDHLTPNLRAIVQEIVGQTDWQPYHAMTFIIAGSGERTAESYEGNDTRAAELTISYTMENNCPAAGTGCDDGDADTVNDQEDGFCNCAGTLQEEEPPSPLDALKNEREGGLELFPIPAGKFLHVSGIKEGTKVYIYDVTGTKVLESKEATIDVSTLSAGWYQLLSETGIHHPFIKK